MISYQKKRLGDILIESGKLTEDRLKEALLIQKQVGKRLGEILVEQNFVTEEDIIEVLEKQLNIERVNLEIIRIDRRAIKMISENVCRKHLIVPYEIDDNDNTIKVAMADPLDIVAIDDVEISTGLNVRPYIAVKQSIQRAIDIYYSNQKVLSAAEELTKEVDEGNNLILDNIEEVDNLDNAPIIKMIEYVMKNAVEERASDIHIESYENILRIRYRIDGKLHTISTLPVDTLAPLVTRIKILANLDISEKRLPQDGRILTRFGDKQIDLRVSILPMITGEKIVIRIINKENFIISKEGLGIKDYELNLLEKITKHSNGIILVTGPTGSGKTTTLYTILNELNTDSKNIITIEDPVEVSIEGINQVNVNNKVGLTFATGLRSILRQDPDIIMIGEIRDSETAQIAIRSAITGHLVLSTLHTNNAPSSILRLEDMGVQRYLIANAIKGVIAQRLVRKICPKCKLQYYATPYEKEILNIDKNEELILHKGKGCAYCNNTGYVGRMGIYEIMEVTKEHREAILENKSADILKEISIKNGMRTLGQACRSLVLEGNTTVEEMLNITYDM
ncbi:GspE/PulE family protein [Clostridium perfringens]|nr:ATPase, T2SS/T4P/T4SS family [Clostridium perfringens]HAT4079024.1 Flp pilus assembly complex ATPase component [Clostridium perfringens]HAT4086727.1 Flp pilus assembly complex ATPase component [Clostridium perfringens]HBC2053090.1 Flp pilus assembly complex ATPase component TadA [Clostridium perfringens]